MELTTGRERNCKMRQDKGSLDMVFLLSGRMPLEDRYGMGV